MSVTGLLNRVAGQMSSTYPPFLERFLELLANCHARGADYVVLQLYRSYPEQSALYNQGRTLPGAIVTNARAGRSSHNFGCAADVVFDTSSRAGLQPGWGPTNYTILGEECARVGLEWAGNWAHFKEYGHVGWPDAGTPTMLKKLDAAFRFGGLPAAWALLDGTEPERVA